MTTPNESAPRIPAPLKPEPRHAKALAELLSDDSLPRVIETRLTAPKPRFTEPWLALTLVRSGAYRKVLHARGGDRVLQVSAGDLLLAGPDFASSLQPERPTTAWRLQLHPELPDRLAEIIPDARVLRLLQQFAGGMRAPGVVSLPIWRASSIAMSLSRFRDTQQASAAARLDIATRLLAVLAELDAALRETGPRRVLPPHSPVRGILQLVDAAPFHPWTVAALARQAHLSRSQLDRRFRQELGMSPSEYVQLERMRCLAKLLTTTELSAAEAARLLGWQGESAEIEPMFRRHWGMGTAEFRRGATIDQAAAS